MYPKTAVLCLLALSPSLASAQASPGALQGGACLEVTAKIRASFTTGNPGRADAALSELLAGANAKGDPLCVVSAIHNLAKVYENSGRVAEAEALERRSLLILDTTYPPNDPIRLQPLVTLWAVSLQLGKLAKAREAFHALSSIPLVTSRERAIVSSAAAEQFLMEGRYPDAEREFNNALKEWDIAGLGETLDTAAVLVGLGSLYAVQGRYKDAESVLQRAYQIVNSSRDTLPSDRVKVLSLRGILRTRQERWREAKADLIAAISTADRDMQIDPAQLKPLLEYYAFVLRKIRQNKQARSIEARARSIDIPGEARSVADITQLPNGSKPGKK